MEDWDQETLEKVVESKKSEYNHNKPTEIVCKYFLGALEKKQYGWFWVCPNGGKDCHCRHALPPRYVLKSQIKALLDEGTEKIAVEDEIENQCAKLTVSTPMTPELFMQWKKKEKKAGLQNEQTELRMIGRAVMSCFSWIQACLWMMLRHMKNTREMKKQRVLKIRLKDGSAGPSTSSTAVTNSEEILPDDDDDDDLDMDELNEIEAI
ncbi:zinc finger CCCH domain-containing protein 21-like [Mangifera indica]|uniref:zinc finger CCCH domain-containing protein 21-like n=1 Tax=Mangifera indica TaxID=29780 RepID=UPI001CFB8F21|nr:zinc finger CCCH domain-containing protein 21-like [Mangifera indica]